MLNRFLSVTAAALGFALMLNVYCANVVDPMYFAEIAAVGATPEHTMPSALMHEQLVAFDLR